MAEIDTLYAFGRLYGKAAADRRGDALFGADSFEKSVRALKQYALTGVSRILFDFEFPFTGKPRMDLLVGYECGDLSSPVRFGEGKNVTSCARIRTGTSMPGIRNKLNFLQRFFDACAGEPGWEHYACGYSFDLSTASEGIPVPGLYILPPPETPLADYAPKFLKITGFEERTNDVMTAFANAPKAWRPHYVGAMAGRRQTPIRLGFLLERKDSLHYSGHLEEFARDIEAYMGLPVPGPGKETLSVLAEGGFICDLQFDLYPGGVIGNGLGVSVNFGFHALDPRKSAGFLENGIGGDMMRRIEKMGLADSRWRKMDSACYASEHIVRHSDGHCFAGEAITLDGIKVRFKDGMPFVAKGYLLGQYRYL